MTTESLIQKIEAEILPAMGSDERHGWNTALYRAIAIIRQHEGQQNTARGASSAEDGDAAIRKDAENVEVPARTPGSVSAISPTTTLNELAMEAAWKAAYDCDARFPGTSIQAIVACGVEAFVKAARHDPRGIKEPADNTLSAFEGSNPRTSPPPSSSEIPVIDYGQLAGHVASALGTLKGYGHENTAGAKSLQYVLDELMKAYNAPKRESGK